MTDTPDHDRPTGGMPDLGGLLESAQQMMAQAQAAASRVVEGASGGGLVKVAVDGHFEFHCISIDPSVVDPDDVAMLEDLVLAALNDTMQKIGELQAGSLGGSLGGLDMGSLGGLGGLLGGN